MRYLIQAAFLAAVLVGGMWLVGCSDSRVTGPTVTVNNSDDDGLPGRPGSPGAPGKPSPAGPPGPEGVPGPVVVGGPVPVPHKPKPDADTCTHPRPDKRGPKPCPPGHRK